MTSPANPPLILVSNDDGIQSPGLKALIVAASSLGNVLVVAPREQQSSVGRSFLGGSGDIRPHDLGLQGSGVTAYSVDGTPASAVRKGVQLLADRKPGLCIAGINYGENLGAGITISGTIGACLEAAGFGIPGIAISLETDPEYHYRTDDGIDFSVAAGLAQSFARIVLQSGLPKDVDILKIDVPSTAGADTPWKVTQVSRHTYYRDVVGINCNGQRDLVGYEVRTDFADIEPDSDIYALALERVISVAPLSVTMRSGVSTAALTRILAAKSDT